MLPLKNLARKGLKQYKCFMFSIAALLTFLPAVLYLFMIDFYTLQWDVGWKWFAQ